MLDFWWWTEKLSETCRVLFQKWMWGIVASRWVYYKNIRRMQNNTYTIDMASGIKVKVKQSHYRPEQAQRVPGGWGSQISRQSAYQGGKVVSSTHRPPLPPKKYSWYSFLLGAESNPGPLVWPEGLCQWKIPMTPSGIEPWPATYTDKMKSMLHLENFNWVLKCAWQEVFLDITNRKCKQTWRGLSIDWYPLDDNTSTKTQRFARFSCYYFPVQK